MNSNQWDNLKKDMARAKKLMQQAGVPGILLQLRWGSLSKAQRKKIEQAAKGKGWFEEKEEVVTAKGTETKAPKHRKAALKAHGDGAINEPIRTEPEALNKRMERKEEKVVPDEPTKKEEDGFVVINGKKVSDTKYQIHFLFNDNTEGNERDWIEPDVLKDYINDIRKKGIISGKRIESFEIIEVKVKQTAPNTPIEIVSQKVILRDKPTKLYTIPEQPREIKLDADEEKFVRGIYKQVSDGATVKEFGTRLYVWRSDEAYATKHITDSEYMVLKAIIKGVHQLSRADALKNLKEGREKEAKIVQKIEGRKEQEHKSFKEAQKHPKGGAVAADADNIQAWTAEMIARRFALNPEAVYNWAQKHNTILKNIFNKEALGDGTNIIEAILNDTELGKPIHKAGKYFITIGIGKGKHREYVTDVHPFEVMGVKLFSRKDGSLWRVTEQSTGVEIAVGLSKKGAESNAEDVIVRQGIEPLMSKLKKIESSETPRDLLDENLAEQQRKKEEEQEKEKKAREKWVAEARNPPPRKPAKRPEIEFNTEPPTTKKEVPETEGLLIRGLTEEQAEEFRKELKEKVKSIKVEISIREGAGGKHELYTQVPIDPKSINGALKLFTKRFGKKPERKAKNKPAHESTPLLVEYKCRDEPPVKVPIEKLDEAIEKCKKEGEAI